MPAPPPNHTEPLRIVNNFLPVGHFMQYKCSEGYELVDGDLELLCSSNKTIIGDIPVCRGWFIPISWYAASHVYSNLFNTDA